MLAVNLFCTAKANIANIKMMKNRISKFVQPMLLIGIICIVFPSLISGQSNLEFDLVLQGGQVIDPETKLDAVRNVGIRNGRIVEISAEPLICAENIDVFGLVIAPGFIDLHVHGITNKEQEHQVHDGVTTALELDVGVPYITSWHKSRNSNALINYGTSASWPFKRAEVMEKFNDELEELITEFKESGWNQEKLSSRLTLASNYAALPTDKIPDMLAKIRSALEEGALGVAVPTGYLPGARREEVLKVYQLAGNLQVPVFTHVRIGESLALQL